MKKEVLIAIFVGLSMGLIITFGVYRVKTSITEQPIADFIENEEDTEVTATPTLLALHSPEDNTIQTEKELIITGTTIQNTFIVVFVNDEDYLSTSDESGNFSVKVELEENENIIRVHVVDEESASVVEERLVVFTDAFEKLEAQQAEEQSLEATTSSDIEEKTDE